MLPIRLRTVLIALVALVALGGIISVVPALQGNHSAASCKTTRGGKDTALVIDYGSKSSVQSSVTCISDFTGTGWELLVAANAKPEGTADYPTGFVCRIGTIPSRDSETCLNTPSSKVGHWAYFYATASRGNTWHFSPQGASMRKPICGDWDGWRFVESGESAASSLPRVTPKPTTCK